jgi:hypothetical protein
MIQSVPVPKHPSELIQKVFLLLHLDKENDNFVCFPSIHTSQLLRFKLLNKKYTSIFHQKDV